MIEGLPITIRQVNQNDLGYILSTWSTEYHKITPVNFIPNSIYFPSQKKIITRILNRSQTLVAHLDEEPDNIVAYLVFEPFDESNIIIHWACTKSIFRRQGVMHEILALLQVENKNLMCSHYFQLFKKLKDRYNLIYSPNLLEVI